MSVNTNSEISLSNAIHRSVMGAPMLERWGRPADSISTVEAKKDIVECGKVIKYLEKKLEPLEWDDDKREALDDKLSEARSWLGRLEERLKEVERIKKTGESYAAEESRRQRAVEAASRKQEEEISYRAADFSRTRAGKKILANPMVDDQDLEAIVASRMGRGGPTILDRGHGKMQYYTSSSTCKVRVGSAGWLGDDRKSQRVEAVAPVPEPVTEHVEAAPAPVSEPVPEPVPALPALPAPFDSWRSVAAHILSIFDRNKKWGSNQVCRFISLTNTSITLNHSDLVNHPSIINFTPEEKDRVVSEVVGKVAGRGGRLTDIVATFASRKFAMFDFEWGTDRMDEVAAYLFFLSTNLLGSDFGSGSVVFTESQREFVSYWVQTVRAVEGAEHSMSAGSQAFKTFVLGVDASFRSHFPL